jgi:hypothetical protein
MPAGHGAERGGDLEERREYMRGKWRREGRCGRYEEETENSSAQQRRGIALELTGSLQIIQRPACGNRARPRGSLMRCFFRLLFSLELKSYVRPPLHTSQIVPTCILHQGRRWCHHPFQRFNRSIEETAGPKTLLASQSTKIRRVPQTTHMGTIARLMCALDVERVC